MSTVASRIAQDIRNAYEAHDRDGLEHALTRLVKTAGPTPDRVCSTCAHEREPILQQPCSRCSVAFGTGEGFSVRWEATP